MKYFKLLYDYENDTDSVLGIAKEMDGIDQYDLKKGCYIEKWNPNLTFCYDSNEGDVFTDYLGNNLAWFVISNRLKVLFETIGCEKIQYLPVKIYNINDNSVTDDYYVANIFNIQDALDLENSKYDEWIIDDTSKMLSIECHALKEDKLRGIHILKLQADPFPIFVSEKVKSAIKKHGITGCDFLEVKVV